MALLRILGPIEVWSPDAILPDPKSDKIASSERLRRLLCALIVNSDRVVGIDRLAFAVWGDDQPGDPTSALHNLAFRLRSELRRRGVQGIEIHTVAPGYRLVVGAGAIDSQMFTDGVRAACSGMDADPEATLRQLDECEALWRGGAFGDLCDEVWLQPAVARLDELRLRGIEAAADALLLLGRPSEAVERLLPWTMAHPFVESLHMRHMQALAAANRPTEALAVYRALSARLAEQLGTDPTPEVSRVHLEILQQRVPVAGRTRERMPGLIGRSAELSAVRALTARHRVVTVVGVGGVGKTSLALALQRGGGWVAELAAVDQGDAVVHRVAEATGVHLRRDRSPIEALGEALADSTGQLVLDNCEHLVEAAAQVASVVLRQCPRINVLATSRVPLRIAGEAVFELKPLAPPSLDDREIATVGHSPAVQLFVERVRAREPGFMITADNCTAVAEVCRRLDGVPLSVELAATRMHAVSPEALAERLQWRFRVLSGGRATDPRHRSLHAVVDWSYALLEPEVQVLFEALSVFPGAFDLTAAEQLIAELGGSLPDVVAGVAELVDSSMLTSERNGYRMLETLRDFGRERLGHGGARDAVSGAHARLVASRLGGLARHLWGSGHQSAARLVTGSLDDVRQAVDWARHHDLELAGELLAGCLPCLELTMSTEITGWARDLIRDAELTGESAQVPRAAQLVAACGARFDGDLPAAHRWAEVVVAGGATAAVEVHAEMILAEVAMFQGNMESARRYCQAMRTAAAKAGMHGAALLAEGCLLLVEEYANPRRDSLELARAASALADEAGAANEDVVEFWARYMTGECLLDEDPARAAALLDEAIEGGRSTGDRYLEGVSMVSRASIEARVGDPRRAAAMFKAASVHWQEAGNWTHQWVSLRSVCELLARAGAVVAAARLLGAVVAADGHTGTGVQGEDAVRLGLVKQELVDRLGAVEVARLMALGAVMDRDTVVRAAVEALTAVSEGSEGFSGG